MSVHLDFALVVGSELLRADEVDPSDPQVRSILETPPFDGAWLITVDEDELLDENLWDRLDVILLDIARKLRKLGSAPSKASIVFPDTRATVRFERDAEGTLTLRHEGNEVTCSFEDFKAAAEEMASRFADLVRKSTGRLPAAYLPLARLAGGGG
jgi:hypothetical protein